MSSLHVPSANGGANSKPVLQSKQTMNRLPPPALFQGPPSRNASNISLSLPGTNSSSIGQPISATSSHVQTQQPQKAPRFSKIPESRASFLKNTGRAQEGEAKNENDRADALWAEMQNTLAEVELSASSGSHVFSTQHAKALEDLRTTQLALAQAWAKSEADEMENHPLEEMQDAKIGGRGVPSTQASPGKRGGRESRNSSRQRNLEAETETDILLARKRREANDRYFKQVNTGVLDVVAKLEDVATAMRQVEKESREIWNESDSSGSVTGSATDAADSPMANR